jgi:hypothetical protein
MRDQLAFDEMLATAHDAALDRLRSDVADWFASLTPRQRDAVASWVTNCATQFDAFAAMAAEAGSWEHDRRKELIKCLA